MKVFLTDRDSTKTIFGNSISEVISKTGLFEMDFERGRMIFRGKADTITYNKSLTEGEMFRFMTERAEVILSRSGWKFYFKRGENQ